MNKPLLVVTAKTMHRVLPHFEEQLAGSGWLVKAAIPRGQYFAAEELLEACAGARAVIVGDDEVSADFLNGMSDVLGLVVKWGVGTDSIDFDTAGGLGIEIHNTPGVFGAEVADLAMAYVLALARNIVKVDAAVRAKEWPQPIGVSLEGRVMGVIGMGDAGTQLAKRSRGFGMETLFYDPFVFESTKTASKVEDVSQVFMAADFLVLTCPSTDETRGIVNGDSLMLMKPSSFLINVARGDLVVEDDLAHSLKSGAIGGAALDVFQVEPLPRTSALRNFGNVLLGAHNGSNTNDALYRASEKAVKIANFWKAANLP